MKAYPESASGPIQVLIADDAEGAADAYAELVSQQTSLIVGATRYPMEAADAVREHPILVVVLDQIFDQIPEPTTGTQVFQELRSISQDFAAVMLSGQAPLGDAGLAARLGYVDILDKAEVEKLPSIVRDLYFSQLTKLVAGRRFDPIQLTPARRSLGIRHRPEMSLISLDLLDAEYVPASAWHTYLQVSAGQADTREIVLSVERRVQLISESRTLIKSTVGAKALGSLESKLEGSVEDILKQTVEMSSSLTKRVTVTYSLPQPEAAVDEYVRARNFEYAPVFQRYRGMILTSCKQCSGSSLHAVELIAATGRFASRHVDTLASGRQDIVVTGMTLDR